jgi:hypothetical protein
MSDPRQIVGTELLPGRFRTFEQVADLIFEFEKTLGTLGIKIAAGSKLENACLSGLRILMAHTNSIILDPRNDIRPEMVNVRGLWQFAERVNRLKGQPLLEQLKPHLRLMSAGDFAQNRKSSCYDQACNKLFELLIGLAVADIGTDTELDHPDASSGKNPDVLTTIAKKRWRSRARLCRATRPRPFTTVWRWVQRYAPDRDSW